MLTTGTCLGKESTTSKHESHASRVSDPAWDKKMLRVQVNKSGCCYASEDGNDTCGMALGGGGHGSL